MGSGETVNNLNINKKAFREEGFSEGFTGNEPI
jgi:hypothetical protein